MTPTAVQLSLPHAHHAAPVAATVKPSMPPPPYCQACPDCSRRSHIQSRPAAALPSLTSPGLTPVGEGTAGRRLGTV